MDMDEEMVFPFERTTEIHIKEIKVSVTYIQGGSRNFGEESVKLEYSKYKSTWKTRYDVNMDEEKGGICIWENSGNPCKRKNENVLYIHSEKTLRLWERKVLD